MLSYFVTILFTFPERGKIVIIISSILQKKKLSVREVMWPGSGTVRAELKHFWPSILCLLQTLLLGKNFHRATKDHASRRKRCCRNASSQVTQLSVQQGASTPRAQSCPVSENREQYSPMHSLILPTLSWELERFMWLWSTYDNVSINVCWMN